MDNWQSLSHMSKLLDIMQQLRDPDKGCPWDKQQNFSSIVPYTIEEVYEVADAIAKGDMVEIKDELGDLLFQVVFYAQLGHEENAFEFDDIAGGVCEKLIRRHPHIFGDEVQQNAEAVSQRWDEIKRQEKLVKGIPENNSILDDIPQGMTPLLRAEKIQNRCAKVGFDWDDVSSVFAKVREEIVEIEQEVNHSTVTQEKVAEEVGDLLFAVVNLSRHLGVNAETALINANQKFSRRFGAVEKQFEDANLVLSEANLEQMESVWQSVKSLEKKQQ